jgi:hypothetical protein
VQSFLELVERRRKIQLLGLNLVLFCQYTKPNSDVHPPKLSSD